MYDPSKRDWDRVEGLVFDGITETKCSDVVRSGLIRAKTFLSAAVLCNPVPTISDVRTAHGLAFHEVYPFAGNFRQYQQEVAIGERDNKVYFQPAYYLRIEPELKRLEQYTRENLNQHDSQHVKAEVIALYHAQFERIHPFLDGNGRIGRLVLEAQITHVLGLKPEPILDRETYLEALWHAQTTGTLSQLSYSTTGIALGRTQTTSYERELWPIILDKTTDHGHTLKVECTSIDDALDVESAKITPALQRYLDQHGTRNVPLLLDQSVRPLRLDLDRELLAQTHANEQTKDDLTIER